MATQHKWIPFVLILTLILSTVPAFPESLPVASAAVSSTNELPGYDFHNGVAAHYPLFDTGAPNSMLGAAAVGHDVTQLSYANQTEVSFTAPATANGLEYADIGTAESHGAHVNLGGRAAIEVSPNGYAYFDVDNTFIFQGQTGYGDPVRDVEVEISYFDRGHGLFFIQYDSTRSTMPATSFNLHIRTDNIVFLSNSGQWLTATFTLPDVYFGNRNLLANMADFRITYAVSTPDAIVANMGHLLAFDRVTVRRSPVPLDRAGRLAGNYYRMGDPISVWTRLAAVNDRGHGLFQVEGNGAATTTATSVPGIDQDTGASPIEVRRVSGGSISFDVNDNYIFAGNAQDVFIGVEYYDDNFGNFWIEYDAGPTQRNKQTRTVAGTSTSSLRRALFYLPDAHFGNGQAGGADFRIRTSGTTLKVRSVHVQRIVGSQVLPRGAVNISAIESFSRFDRVVASHYFPVFDGFYPSGWERSTMGPAGANPTTHVLNSYSWRSIDALKRELEDARDAGIDMLIIWYAGNTTDGAAFGLPAIRNLVAAARQVNNPPKFGILLDPVMLYNEHIIRQPVTRLDYSDPTISAWFMKLAADFFSIVPTDLWAAVDGRPVIFVYFQGEREIERYDSSMFQTLRTGFVRNFGVEPYLIADNLYQIYQPLAVANVAEHVDEFFSWAASYCTGCTYASAGLPQNDVMAIGPGFDDGPRVRSRDNGEWYRAGWQRAVAKGMHMVVVDTFNYWVEGTAIANSDLYGRQYLDLTHQFATLYKQTNHAQKTTVSTTLGSTLNIADGLYLDTILGGAGTTSVVTRGGLEGRVATGIQFYFSVDDTFLYDVPSGTLIDISVTYWDEPPAPGQPVAFELQYDGDAGPYTKDTNRLTHFGDNSRTWRTVTFTITDAVFKNRQDGKNDFVLLALPGTVAIRSVAVTRPASMLGELQPSPAGIRVDAGIGGAQLTPITRSLTLTYEHAGAGSWSASVDRSWLTLSAMSGTAPQTIVLTINVAQIQAEGKSFDTATITFTGMGGVQTKVTVAARVGEAPFRTVLPIVLSKYDPPAGGW